MIVNRFRAVALAVFVVLALLPVVARAEPPSPPVPDGLQELVGALHEHSGYSDGWPGTRPADYFASAKRNGLDFLGSGEHSDNADVPVTFSGGCVGPGVTGCVGDQRQPLDSARKWDATLEQARGASDASFTGFRGFEWSSDRYGHINVYFSRRDTNAKADGGYVTMGSFWRWFTTRPEQGGGADGLGTFNHPGSKKLDDADPGKNWDDFAYVPDADERMVGLEVFNDTDEYGTRGPDAGWYVNALDKGWHVGAVGAEDVGHGPDDDWGGPRWPKTVILAADRSEASMRAAMLARRFYAVRDGSLRLDFTVDGALMGARLVRPAGAVLAVAASVNRPDLALEVVTSGGRVVAAGTGSLAARLRSSEANRWYFVRARAGGEVVAYGSPVWVSAAPGAAVGEWLAGDLHVHTCYSSGAYCGPGDDNDGPEDAYTASGTVDERFLEASAKGLDFLAITDHNDVRSRGDPGFGSHAVIGVPGYENSIRGHAQMLGTTRLFDNGDAGTAAISAIARDLRAEGGVLQANHPADGLDGPLSCDDTSGLNWQYGFDVVPDTIEVWNISHLLQPPLPAGTSNADAVRYWECWLERGARVGATGGSDSHWISTAAVQGVGNPTTWVFARERSARGVLDALREGRTSVSFQPPAEGAMRMVLEADADGDGAFEATIGDTVPPGTTMRVRATGLPEGGIVEVRANGRTLLADAPLPPGGEVRFPAPAEPGWVRATLLLPDGRDARTTACEPVMGSVTSYCRNPIIVRALTSPIYLRPNGTHRHHHGRGRG